MIFHLTLWKQPIWLLGFKFWLYTRIVANPTQETICFRYQFGFKVWIYHWSIYLEAGQFKLFSFVGETLADLESAARPQILANLARFVQSKTKFQCQFNKFTIQSIHHFPHSMHFQQCSCVLVDLDINFFLASGATWQEFKCVYLQK